jgi:trk system potassium uptake protein TrkH
VLAAVGALPFVLSGTLSPVDAYFESMSGFTTTGSTVIADIEAVDLSVLFWRSFTHWLGGMGIIVLFIAVLPYLGAGGKQLYKSESPGPDPRGISPRIKDTASLLWKIYLGLTAVQTLLLMAFGMSFYEALCHTFGTIATGGFSTRQASVAAFDSVGIEMVIILFMVLAGTNFTLFFMVLRGDWAALFRSTEWRVYLLIMFGASGIITLNLMGAQGTLPIDSPSEAIEWHTQAPPIPDTGSEPGNLSPAPASDPQEAPLQAFRMAAFQSVSIMTTTGFCTANFNEWPPLSRLLLVTLMFVGGCAGSTGGGMKVVRVILLVKMVMRRLEQTFRPKTVRAIRISGTVIDSGIQDTVLVFFVLHMAIFLFGTLAMSAFGLPFESAFSAVAATLNNIGPGLELVGATQDFHLLPSGAKMLLSLFMAMGRLELFSICVLFLPAFWKHS